MSVYLLVSTFYTNPSMFMFRCDWRRLLLGDGNGDISLQECVLVRSPRLIGALAFWDRAASGRNRLTVRWTSAGLHHRANQERAESHTESEDQ